jgi:hypothetical protein
MFKVEQVYDKYKINIGDRKTYYAKNEEQVCNAFKHYYVKEHDKNNCPFCKEK